MDRVFGRILKRRTRVLLLLTALALAGFAASGLIAVDIVPPDAASSPDAAALREMNAQFPPVLPNLRVMVQGVTLAQARALGEQIALVRGVRRVVGPGGVAGSGGVAPFGWFSPSSDAWYHDEAALFSLTVSEASLAAAARQIRVLAEGRGMLTGVFLQIEENGGFPVGGDHPSGAQETGSGAWVFSDGDRPGRALPLLSAAFVALLALALVLVSLFSVSWFTPVLFLLTLLFSVFIHIGTLPFFGAISSVALLTSLTLLVVFALNATVVLTENYLSFRAERYSPAGAMLKSMSKNIRPFLGAGLAAAGGLAALLFTGSWPGPGPLLCLMRALAASLLSALLFLPCLTVALDKRLEMKRRAVGPRDGRFLGAGVNMVKWLAAPAILFLLPPCLLAATQAPYLFDTPDMTWTDASSHQERAAIQRTFGVFRSFALLVPPGEPSKEEALGLALRAMPQVQTFLSYATCVGGAIPAGFLSQETRARWNSEGYTRLVFTAVVPLEGDALASFVGEVRARADAQYKGAYRLIGPSIVALNAKARARPGCLGVHVWFLFGMTLAFVFVLRSILLPILLTLSAGTCVALGASLSYFLDTPTHYVACLAADFLGLFVAGSIGVLFAVRYLEHRAGAAPRAAIQTAAAACARGALPSWIVLVASGLSLSLLPGPAFVRQVGALAARNVALTLPAVLILLATAFHLFDPLLVKRK